MDYLNNIETIQVSDEEIIEFWKKTLWRDRTDPIRAMSSMCRGGGFDMEIYKKYQPVHIFLRYGNNIIGCNSGHQTSQDDFRSRGLYLQPEYRGMKLSRLLFSAIEKEAVRSRCHTLWSFPRLDALKVYEAYGFKKYLSSNPSPDHCYVQKSVSLTE